MEFTGTAVFGIEYDNPLYEASEVVPSKVNFTPESVDGSENSMSQLSGAYLFSVPVAVRLSVVMLAVQVNGSASISLVDTLSLVVLHAVKKVNAKAVTTLILLFIKHTPISS
jgi:hypothetical protein